MADHLNAQIVSLMANFEVFRKALEKLWSESKFFKYSALVTGSLTGSLALRYLYIRSKRKYYGLAPGLVGLPLLGHSLKVFDYEWLSTVPAQYGDVTSVRLIGTDGVLINDPVLAKKMHHDPRSFNVPSVGPSSQISFTECNGKEWSERRRIISSNLLSTMKADYVEVAMKRFVASKVFSEFDRAIAAGKAIDFKPLLRPIGFNITLQATYGKEIESLDDPLWTRWDELVRKQNKAQQTQFVVAFALGFDSALSLGLQRLLTGSDFISGFSEIFDYVEAFENAKDVDAEKDENVRLFSDFVDDYINNEQGKYSKKQLQGDMSTMFLAATDTTYSAISFALLRMARDQEMQQELHQEAVAAFGSDLDSVQLKGGAISKIPKIRAFIHEVLRIHAPVPATGFREIMVNGVTVGPYNVAKGSMPLINCAAINMNPKYWVKDYDAAQHKEMDMKSVHLEFWIENGMFRKKLQSDNFFAFHTGKRDCVGQALAMKELLVVLAMVLMKYLVTAADGDDLSKIEGLFLGQVVEPKITRIQLAHRK